MAVRVAEMNMKKSSDEASIDGITDDTVSDIRSSGALDGQVEVASCAIPPQLPILLDEAALEDILGVSGFI